MQKTYAVIPAGSGWRLLIYNQEHPERLRYEPIVAWEIQNDETTRKVIPISFETPSVEDYDRWGVVRPDGKYVVNGCDRRALSVLVFVVISNFTGTSSDVLD